MKQEFDGGILSWKVEVGMLALISFRGIGAGSAA